MDLGQTFLTPMQLRTWKEGQKKVRWSCYSHGNASAALKLEWQRKWRRTFHSSWQMKYLRVSLDQTEAASHSCCPTQSYAASEERLLTAASPHHQPTGVCTRVGPLEHC